MKPNERAFLIGLEKLTRETGVVIWGCGCCGSPRLAELERDEEAVPEAGYGLGYAGQVEWLDPTCFGWTNHRGSIVKPEEGSDKP